MCVIYARILLEFDFQLLGFLVNKRVFLFLYPFFVLFLGFVFLMRFCKFLIKQTQITLIIK